MIFQRELFPKSSLQPEAPGTAPALLVRFGPPAPPGSGRMMCGDGGTAQSHSGKALAVLDRVPRSTHCHTLLPEASGEVRDPLDASGQTRVTQPGPMTASLLCQPSQAAAVGHCRVRNPPSATAQAEGKAEWSVFCCLIFEVEFSRSLALPRQVLAQAQRRCSLVT